MSQFDERERGQEKKFSLDQESLFKAQARRDKLLGMWAADLLGLAGAEAETYAKSVVVADLEEPGDEDVIRKLLGDLTAAECDVSEADIRTKLEECSVEARRQFMSDQG